MNIPEKSPATTSGEQVNSLEATEQQTATEQPAITEQQPQSYKSRIDELIKIVQTGSLEEQRSAEEELSSIEQQLREAESDPRKLEKLQKPQEQTPATETPAGDSAGIAAPKKFSVNYNGQRVELEDGNNLLGYKNTGALKEALAKTQLILKDRETREQQLVRELKEAQEKLASLSRVAQPPAQPSPLPSVPPPAQPQPAKPAVPKPVPPPLPKLSTNDPSLYSDADIEADSDYREKMRKFNEQLVEYSEYMATQNRQVDPALQKRLDELEAKVKQADEILGTVKEKEKTLAEQQRDAEHWQRFVDFGNKHESIFKMPKHPKQMNDEVVTWLSRIAVANGVPENEKWSLVGKYLEGDPTVVQNSQGIEPPEGYEKYFKNLEVFSALKRYIREGVLTEKATLEQAYALHKVDSGELANDLETLRTSERARGAEVFSASAQQLQQSAVNIDPTKSSGGPDLSAIGVSIEDLKWFQKTNPDMLQKDIEALKKWEAIGNKIVKFAG